MKVLRRLLVPTLVLVAVLALAPAAGASAKHRTHWQHSRFGATTVALDASAAAALTSLGVTPSPIPPARADDDGLRFPIVNSFFNALRTGTVRHSGGIALTAGATRVELTDFYINIDSDPDLTALVGGGRVSILGLSFADARVRFRNGELIVGPVAATLTDAAATALNTAFGLPAGTVPAGLKLADATVRYRLF
jgi:hypothetical protein